MKKILIIIASVFVIVGGYYLLSNTRFFDPMKTEYKPALTEEEMAANTLALEQISAQYTLQEVAQHATPDDCYTAIDGRVYDVTAWIDVHPGGDENILLLCGIDGSKLFNGQHGGNIQVQNTLAEFQIGVLAQ